MASADLDYCELSVTIKNWQTGQPYIDEQIGQWSCNIPVESIEFVDMMYEPTAQQMSTATITFPTVMQNPSMIPLLQQVQEGDRVELYNFQPDCGLPVFGGFIPPGGITVEMGRMIITMNDVMGRGQWERIRPYEDFDTNAAGYYDRAMHHWKDYMNEDFNIAQAVGGTAAYASMYNSITPANISQGVWHIPPDTADTLSTNLSGSPTISFNEHQKVLIECRGLSYTDWNNGSGDGSLIINQLGLENSSGDTLYLVEYTLKDSSKPVTGNVNRATGIQANSLSSPAGYASSPAGSLPQDGVVNPASNLYALVINLDGPSSVSIEAYVNYVQVAFLSNIELKSLDGFYFSLGSSTDGALGNTYQEWYTLRVRYLVPWLTPASQFNPQTNDATEFQANNDDLYTFLNNFVEIDFAEYRPIYQSAPAIDQLALDGVGLVGINASQTLGIDLLTDQSAPRLAGTPLGAESADFSEDPMFRFEEGWNFADYPALQQSQLTHANDIVRMGSGNTDAQNFYDRWNVEEVGNPFGASTGLITGATPQFPYFEALINDDRTSLPDVISTLCDNDLIVRGAPVVPTLELQITEDVRWNGKYRAGDFVRVKTKSLINNVDQDLRIMSITHEAGSPNKDIVVGRLPYDPTMRGKLAKAMVESWLYTQSGAGQLVIVYPFVPVTLTTLSPLGTTMQVPLNQFTTASAITYAGFHWFTNGTDPVSDIAVAISGSDPTLANPTLLTTTADGQDSTLTLATGLFPAPGIYYFAPKNIGLSDRTVNSMYLIIKMKV